MFSFVVAFLLTICALTYNDDMVKYVETADNITIVAICLSTFAIIQLAIESLFTNAFHDSDEGSDSDKSGDWDDDDDDVDVYEDEEIYYNSVPSTPDVIESPNSRRRLQQSNEQINEYKEYLGTIADNDDDSDWTPK